MTVLSDVKKAVGVHHENTDFDVDIKMAINTSLFELMQLGAIAQDHIPISTGDEEWSDYLGGRNDLEAAKNFVYIGVRLIFDRPDTSYGIQALERQQERFGWRLKLQAEEDA